MFDLRNIDEVDGEINDSDNSETSKDSDHRRQKSNRLRPFYVNRKDILTLFDDEKLRKTFRFDLDSINFITCIFVVPWYILLLMFNSFS